jgi:hypothetical protein
MTNNNNQIFVGLSCSVELLINVTKAYLSKQPILFTKDSFDKMESFKKDYF